MNKTEAAAVIEKYSREGDIINLDSQDGNIFYQIGFYGIRQAQKKLFGEKSQWQDVHTMMKFNNSTIQEVLGQDEKVKKILEKNEKPWKKVFSVEPPLATFIPVEKFALDHLTIYRYTRHVWTKEDIKILLQATLPILLTYYDFGQLIDILVNQMLGYPYINQVQWFDFSSKMKVCSVGIGAVIQKWRKILEQKGADLPPRLFSRLNPAYWSKEFIADFEKNNNRWHIENYYPALFANSHMFDNEFKLILEMKNGKIIYEDKGV